ncbi:MAG TPA: transglycosylase domain-containing protein, partial [Thermodesulfovibrionales bacterium]|nr:transglycosylase domain-containing protein [Thermodesulfovibrionales bacterium]
LNVAEWGDAGIFGIEMAARHYYGKSAVDLTPGEAARLASVLPNPRKFNPLGNSRYVEHRSNLIYSIMVKRGIVVPEYDEIIEGEKGEDKDSVGSEKPLTPEGTSEVPVPQPPGNADQK